MWYLVYLAMCAVNSFLVAHFTDLGPADLTWWLWTSAPILSYIAGRYHEEKLGGTK